MLYICILFAGLILKPPLDCNGIHETIEIYLL